MQTFGKSEASRVSSKLIMHNALVTPYALITRVFFNFLLKFIF
jgi:hypothetical protein